MIRRRTAVAGGFTLLEAMLTIVVLSILAAVAVPRFVGVSTEARTSGTQAALAGVRASIAAFRTRAMLAGGDAFPTLAELQTDGAVLQSGLPTNPFNNRSAVQSVDEASADARVVSGVDTYGWNYFVDNVSDPPVAIFYANTDDETSLTGDGGVAVPASGL